MRVGYSPVRFKNTVNHCDLTIYMRHFERAFKKEQSKGFVCFQTTSSIVSNPKENLVAII